MSSDPKSDVKYAATPLAMPIYADSKSTAAEAPPSASDFIEENANFIKVMAVFLIVASSLGLMLLHGIKIDFKVVSEIMYCAIIGASVRILIILSPRITFASSDEDKAAIYTDAIAPAADPRPGKAETAPT
jgi:hypothetical protein